MDRSPITTKGGPGESRTPYLFIANEAFKPGKLRARNLESKKGRTLKNKKTGLKPVTRKAQKPNLTTPEGAILFGN